MRTARTNLKTTTAATIKSRLRLGRRKPDRTAVKMVDVRAAAAGGAGAVIVAIAQLSLAAVARTAAKTANSTTGQRTITRTIKATIKASPAFTPKRPTSTVAIP